MSDGTATLRFLDPNTLAETRRITVRDKGRPLYDLNELEYVVDGPHVAQPPPAVKPKESPSPPAVKSKESPPRAGVPHADSDSQPGAAGPQIFANIWQSDTIVVIDPDTGRVTGRLDLSALYPRPRGSEAVLNGIAFLPQSRHLLITGKLWPKLYEIELTPAPAAKGQQ